MDDNKHKGTDFLDDNETISAVAYEPPDGSVASTGRPHINRGTLVVALVFAVAALFAVFLLSAQSLLLNINPVDASVEVDGSFSLRLADRLLVRPGNISLEVSADGYYPQSREIQVSDADNPPIEVSLRKLPGRVSVSTAPESAQLFVDGQPIYPDESGVYLIDAGEHQIRAEAERFQPLEQAVSIEGMEREQSLTMSLAPAWGSYTINSEPAGARILVNGDELATTPATIELLEGEHQISLVLDGHEPDAVTLAAVAGESRTLDTRTLRVADGRLKIKTVPDGASITVNGEFSGQAPLELALRSGQKYNIEAFKAGYNKRSQSLSVESGKSRDLTLTLSPVTGKVTLQVEPADASVWLGNKRLGKGSGSFELPASRQTLTVKADGHAEQSVAVTPRPGFPQTLRVRLLTEAQQKIAEIKPRIESPAGQELVLLRPTPFTMGASRREPGRRANEVLRSVTLKKPFYLATNEVTNAQFRAFKSGHNSGNFKGKSLNGESQPVVNISWQDAALYCNWLSEQEGLEPVYVVQKGTVVGFVAEAPGYRLPTESEWAWAARMRADGTLQKFGWGDNPPPPKGRVGNYADKSAANLLGDIIQGYDDGYAVSAPIGSFKPDRHGIHDLGGNVAEWTHDFYASAMGQTNLGDDPLGPTTGTHHLIRGPSWRHGGMSEIRLSFRDYGTDPRPDLGFRVARYLQ